MFGHFYVEYDRALIGESPCGTTSPASYAAVLLAELLDRAAVLGDIAECAAAEEISEGSLWRAVEVFLRDAEEARTRALRARLLARTQADTLDPWSVDPDDTLEDLGGPLTSATDARD